MRQVLLAMAVASLIGVATAGVTAHDGAAANAVECPPGVVSFVNALTQLEGRLDVGLSLTEYRRYLTAATVAYDRISWHTTPLECVKSVGVPAEKALNAYGKGFTSWQQCVQKVVAGFLPNCTSGAGYAFRQREWGLAKLDVTRATNALGG